MTARLLAPRTAHGYRRAMMDPWIGSHTAMRFGAKVIRPLLVALSLGLTTRLLWTYFTP